MTLASITVESDLAGFLACGHSRTRATELTIDRAVVRARDAAAVVLVEGLSDAIALEIIALQCGRNLDDEQVAIVPMGGVTNIARFVSMFGRRGLGLPLAGLYDVGAEDHVRRVLETEAPAAPSVTPGRLDGYGFYACVEDLEDELLRSLGTARVLRIVEDQGDLTSFRTRQQEPHHRGRSEFVQLHRFVGRWRYRYARLLAEALDVGRIPVPLRSLLDRVERLKGGDGE